MKFLMCLAVMSMAATTTLAAPPVSAIGPKTATYGIHLFFNEKEFVDEMVLTEMPDGTIQGAMHVPKDFDGPLLDLVQKDGQLSFDLLVPKNSSRPTDLVFHYAGTFFDQSKEQMTGFVTIKDEPGFVASFVAFLRN